MKLTFSGLENSLEIVSGQISVLQIESVGLFSRICQSLFSVDEREVLESFSVWNEKGEEVSSKNAFLKVSDPFNLPWSEKSIVTSLYGQIDGFMKEDDSIRQKIEAAHNEFENLVSELSLRLNGSYSFALEWGISQSLKAYSFGINRDDSIRLFDNLIRFIEMLHDISFKRTLVFINLEKFLTKNELIELEKQVFFHNIAVLLLVQGHEKLPFEGARKLYVDQDLLEELS